MILLEKSNLTFRSSLLLLSILTSLVYLSCSESPSSIGAKLVSQDYLNLSELNSDTDSLFQSSSIVRQQISLSNADRLLLGKKDNIEAGILVKFLIYFADSIDTQLDNNEITVTSAFITFTKDYTFGDSIASVDYSVHKVNSNWSTGFTSDSLALWSQGVDYDAVNLAVPLTAPSDSIFRFSLNDTQVAMNWLKAISDTNASLNRGIYIKPMSNTGRILGYYALSTNQDVPIPNLKIVIQKSGVYTDTLSYFPSIDMSIISGSLPDLGTGTFGIQAGLNTKVKLFFDLTSLQKDFIVNYAQLTLTLDTVKTLTGSSFTNSLRVNYLTDSVSLTIDSATVLTLNRDNNTFTGDVTFYIQKCLLDKNFQGFLISAADKLNGVELFAIKSSSAFIYSERPKLQIIYTSRK